MSYWRKLFLVVLLALSLPVQAFAAISMQCAARTEAGERVGARARPAASAHHLDMHRMTLGNDERHPHHGEDAHRAHHTPTCSTCASCCIGAGLPAVPVVGVPADAMRVAIPVPPCAGAVPFLTDGIERPPRYFLV
ncbi:hypothetical protein DIE19_28780 [Burkholderia sp. Bp9126]|nr:hypothetical protein DIE19_28780 [Burkholderia sp. Bp9126]